MTLEDVYKRLELWNKDCLVRRRDNWKAKVAFPSRIVRLLDKNDSLGAFDAFFVFDNKPLILFYEEPKDIRALHRAIWNFNETPIVIVVEKSHVNVCNGFKLLKDDKLLDTLGGADQLDDFTYFKLVTGETWQSWESKLGKDNRVDRLLLKNIEIVLKELCDKYALAYTEANALVGKIIFIRYLIDRKVRLHYRNESKYWTNDDLCNLLGKKDEFSKFISYLQDKDIGFSGDVFPLDKDIIAAIPDEAFQLLICMLKSEVERGQPFLFDMFDFSVLPIEFISNVYEKFIGKENQSKNGAYYTPTFLVDYIVKETVLEFLNHHEGCDCRVLDPSCGSGIFLVASLRQMIDKYIRENGIQKTDKRFKKALVEIVSRNIFGIDKDLSAVHVAIFSIYLTLLDYQSPADIENFKFPSIFGKNLICSNTFSRDAVIHDMEKTAQTTPFDIIIGNPPWKRGGGADYACTEEYIRVKQQTDCDCVVTNKEISQAFLIRSLDFATEKTKCALVVTSKNLYDRNAKKFREYFLRRVFIEEVFELAPVRREVFNKSNDSAIGPACILFFKNANGQKTDNQIVTHVSLKPSVSFTLFKIFSLSSRDIQQVQQNRLMTYDWLWKILLYGSYLDFQFVAQLKGENPTIQEVIADKDRFIYGTGIQFSKKNGQSAEHLRGMDFVDADAVLDFSIDSSKITKFNKNFVHRTRRERHDIFKAPMLLCRKGLDAKRLTLRSALSYKDMLFKDSLTAIKAYRQEDVAVLRNIAGICASDIFTYFAINTFSSVGVEREQFLHDDLFEMPYCQGLEALVEQKESQALVENACVLDGFDGSVTDMDNDDFMNNLNLIIKAVWNVSDVENDLLDYAKTVIRPLIVSRSWEFSRLKERDMCLKKYMQIFIDRFAPEFEVNGYKFYCDHIIMESWIGVRFYINKNKKDDAEKYLFSQKKWINFLIKVSQSQVTERLFVQKDIRGFERNGFYIFKPNIRRLWHPAIARLDVEEFADAIMKSGGAI